MQFRHLHKALTKSALEELPADTPGHLAYNRRGIRFTLEPFMRQGLYTLLLAIGLSLVATTLRAQSAAPDSAADDLAKRLQNPVSNLISVPIESSWEFGLGPTHATDYFGAVKPVIPFPLGADWHLITRTILPFSYSVLLDKGSTTGVWAVPLEVSVSQVIDIGTQSMSLGLTARSHLDRPLFGPRWGLTFTATVIFPKGP